MTNKSGPSWFGRLTDRTIDWWFDKADQHKGSFPKLVYALLAASLIVVVLCMKRGNRDSLG